LGVVLALALVPLTAGPVAAFETVDQFIGADGVGTVEPGFEAATASHDKEFIDFEGDGWEPLPDHTFVPLPPDFYASQGITMVGLDIRDVAMSPFSHSPPIGAWQTGFNSNPAGSYSFIFSQPVASFAMFANDIEGLPVNVTIHQGAESQIFQIPTGTMRFHGFLAGSNVITQIDVGATGDFHIIDDLQFGRIPGPVDNDGDGIDDAIDTGDGAFTDGAGSFGEILDDGGLSLSITDLADPDGVKITANGGAGTATVSACGFVQIDITAGDELDLTCGSAQVDVLSGPVVVAPDGDGIASVTIPSGVTGLISEGENDNFTVEHQAGDSAISVNVDGNVSAVGPGETNNPAQFSANAPPDITVLDNYAVNLDAQPVNVSLSFTDPGSADTHTCEFEWGDGSESSVVDADGLSCASSHTYAEAGDYQLTATVTDDDGGFDTELASVGIFDFPVAPGGQVEFIEGDVGGALATTGGQAGFDATMVIPPGEPDGVYYVAEVASAGAGAAGAIEWFTPETANGPIITVTCDKTKCPVKKLGDLILFVFKQDAPDQREHLLKFCAWTLTFKVWVGKWKTITLNGNNPPPCLVEVRRDPVTKALLWSIEVAGGDPKARGAR
jgi:hypothetical protein